MGCSASKLDSEQCVTRCKDRKHYIKRAVQYRHAFAAAQTAYLHSLKNTGAAIRQFASGHHDPHDNPKHPIAGNPNPNLQYHHHEASSFGPGPPPLPDFLHESPPRTPHLSKSVSMPVLRNRRQSNRNPNENFDTNTNPSTHPPLSVREGEDEEEGEEEREEQGEEEGEEGGEEEDHGEDSQPPPLLSPSVDIHSSPSNSSPYLEHVPSSNANDLEPIKASSSEIRLEKHRRDASSASLRMGQYEVENSKDSQGGSHHPSIPFSKILGVLDDNFLEACNGGKGVARLLEARKMHYHSNAASYSESLEHSSRVLRVMSWGRNPPVSLPDVEKMCAENLEKDTHASTLDKLLAWEKKLHDEVKAGEMIRIDLERKAEQLKSQKKREENLVIINKTKASVKTLRTRYLVEIQAVDAASIEVDNLRDNQLYRHLKDLVKELATMWKCMLICHQKQYEIIENMGPLDISLAPRFTDKHHSENTVQLENEIRLWQENLEKLLQTQKDYMHALYHWLMLHIIQIESDVKETPRSPEKMTTPPIYLLCRAWRSILDRVPETLSIHALKAFSSLLNDLINHQNEELRQKKRLESLRKDLEKKEQLLSAQEMKYKEKWAGTAVEGGSLDEAGQDVGPQSLTLKERERTVNLLKDAVESEKFKYEQMCAKSGAMALSSLEKGLPPVLKAMRDFAEAAAQCYSELDPDSSMNGPAVPRLTY